MPFVGFAGWITFTSGLLATAFMVLGTLFVVLAIGLFLLGKWGLPVRDLEPAERFWYSKEVTVMLVELAPLILSLKEREQSLDLLGVDDVWGREVRDAMNRTETHELWSEFARASALAEEDPKRAVEQLRRLRPRLQECVMELDELLDSGLAPGMPVERGEGYGRA
ncbi:MAG TPA: hypothetical protein VHM16_00475 [Rubrobacteraceae bacterium]|nr:hypothetical protein [Rubrobacteraceae bacterium]